MPVICITGPRQSGKTTLVKHLFGDYKYYNLEFQKHSYNHKLNSKLYFLRDSNGNEIDLILKKVERIDLQELFP